MTPLLTQLVLAVHASATLAMAGLIWFVQIVHYPLMGYVGESRFPAYERGHTRRTSAIVGPLMLAEAATALALPLLMEGGRAALAWTGVTLLAVVWLSTAFVQVPCHRRLEAGFSAAVHARLVATNWVRTAAWSARGVVAVGLV